MHIEQTGRAPKQFSAIGGTGDGADRRVVELLLYITGAELAADQIGQFDCDAGQRPITLRIQRLAGNAANVALIALDPAEPAERLRERIVDPAMNGIDLTVAAVLVDDGAVLRACRSVFVGIDANADRCRQSIELLAKTDVTRQQIVRRRLHSIDRRTERADALIQMGDLKIGKNGKIVGYVEPGVALEARIGLIEAGFRL